MNKQNILNKSYNQAKTFELKLNNINLEDEDDENESDYVTADEMEEEIENENNEIETKIENEYQIDNIIEIENENKGKIKFDVRNKILSDTEFEIENIFEKDKFKIKTNSKIRNEFDIETEKEHTYEVEYNPSNEIELKPKDETENEVSNEILNKFENIVESKIKDETKNIINSEIEIRTNSTIEKEINDIKNETGNKIIDQIENKLKNKVKKIIKAEKEESNLLMEIIRRQIGRNINTEKGTITKYIGTIRNLKNEIYQTYRGKEYLNKIYQSIKNRFSVYKTINTYMKDSLFVKNSSNATTNSEITVNKAPISSDFKFIKESIKNAHKLFTKENCSLHQTYKRLHSMFQWLSIFTSVGICYQKRLGLLTLLHIPPRKWDVILSNFITRYYNIISTEADKSIHMFHFTPIIVNEMGF